jgi:bifunctional non-homologous end joining protein LigD
VEPIIPFEPVRVDHIPLGEKWCFQVKWDGVRMLTYWDGEKVELFNRKKNKRTFAYPELLEASAFTNASSIILDGEIIALDFEGNPSFHEVMRRDGIRNPQKVAMMQEVVPITYMIFDILYLNGQWLLKKTFTERQDLLISVVRPTPSIQIVPTFRDGDALFRTVKSHQLEGVVAKLADSTYGINEKDSRWVKIKNYLDIDAVIGGFTLSNQTVNALLLGLYDENGLLHYIGHVGTGKLTMKDWRDMTTMLTPLQTKESPFVNRPERAAGAHWVLPQHVVKVQFMEWTPGGTLRQPSIQSLVERDPSTCLYE